jgi:hypothetical protein
MSKTNCLLSILAVVIFSIGYLWLDTMKPSPEPASFESAKTAIERIGDWANWLTGLQTAAMAAMFLFIKDVEPTRRLKKLAFAALLFFGASILLSTWVLSALPSIQLRLVPTNETGSSPLNDIYDVSIFSFVHVRLGRLAGLQHTYFLIGIVFFALFLFETFNAPRKPIKNA